MKKSDVPQDKSNLESANIKDMYYALDENGNYITELSTGWNPKTIALDNAIKEIEERVVDTNKRVLNNETSPVEYYMVLHKMDLTILSSYVGFWKWRGKRHFKPSVFNKLKTKTLQKYADVFDITIKQLQDMNH